jgi:low temperature requirement protein LtrA
LHSHDPGRIGAYFHDNHTPIVAGVIVAAIGNEWVIAHPHGRIGTRALAVPIAGPSLYFLGNALYKKVVYGRFPRSHIVGLLLLGVLAPLGCCADLPMVGGPTLLIVVFATACNGCVQRSRSAHQRAAPGHWLVRHESGLRYCQSFKFAGKSRNARPIAASIRRWLSTRSPKEARTP